jgi:hypothetical protein
LKGSIIFRPVDRLCAAIEVLTAERASRSYGPQWITVHDVARHMGITDEQADQAVAEALAQRRIIGDGSNPPHSVALFLGLRESDE